MAVHFIGFRGDEYNSAVQAFGKPDFIHVIHDRRMYGDIDQDNDILVFGPKANPNFICPYTDQDHERH
jgi:hypothetical protein